MFGFFILIASPLDPGLLAPGPFELHQATVELGTRLSRADSVETSLGRVQNAWGEALASGSPPDPCTGAEAGSLVARSRAFGAVYRDAVQSSRAELDRLERIWVAPTVTPLLTVEDRAAADALRTRVATHTRAWLEMSAWQARFVEPATRKCPAQALTAHAGIPSMQPVEGTSLPVAALTVGGGYICPTQDPADGRTVWLPDGLACWGGAECTCAPAVVLPGAVLGPPGVKDSVPTP